MRNLERTARAAGVAAVMLSVALVPATAARATTAASAAPAVVNLGMGAVQTVYDPTRRRVLVSESAADVVSVFKLDGTFVKSIAKQYGAAGMVRVGDSVYVAHGTDGSVHRINLKSLKDTGAVATGLVGAHWIVETGGRLYVTHGTSIASTQIASIDLTTAKVKKDIASFYGADLTTSPALPGRLFVAADGLSPGRIYRLDVRGGTAVIEASNTATDQANLEQLAVSPNGQRLIPASRTPLKFEEMSAKTIQPDGLNYPALASPSAVAVADDANVLAAGTQGPAGAVDVQFFKIGVPSAYATASSGTDGVVPHGLTISDDARHFFVIVADGSQLLFGKVPAPPA